MSSLVFDFGTEDDEKKEKAGAVSAKEAKSAVAGVSAYEDEKGRENRVFGKGRIVDYGAR